MPADTMKKIVCLLGSPRVNGNSERLAKAFVIGAESQGAKVRFFRLQNMNIKGCIDLQTVVGRMATIVINDDGSNI